MSILSVLLACHAAPAPGADVDTDADMDTDADTDADAQTDDRPQTATRLELIPDGTVRATGAIEKPGDVDFYAFDAVAGRDYLLFLEGAGPLDALLDVLGPDLAPYAENDDLPYLMSGTDSGLELRPATGTWYVEIRDHSALTPSPAGGPDYTWTLSVTETTHPVAPDEDANGDDDDASEAASNLVDHDGDGYPDASWSLSPWAPSSPIAWAAGDIGVPGDEDWLWIGVGALDHVQICQFSLFPGLPTALEPVFELYREPCDLFGGDCTGAAALVASTPDPWFSADPGHFAGVDPGIAYPVSLGGMYYLRIADRSGASGPDHWYSALQTCGEEGDGAVEDGLVDLGAAQPLTVTGCAAWVAGFLDGAEAALPNDPQDAFRYVPDSSCGALDVAVDTASAGSRLDAVVSVYREDPPGTFAPVATATGDDPAITGVADPTLAPLVITVASAAGAEGPDQYYLLRVTPAVPAR